MASKETSALARIDGWAITTPNLDSALHSAITAARANRSFTLFTLNLDHLVKLRRNEKFRQAYRNADIVTADGAPVAWLARWQGTAIERAPGADMLVPMAEAAASARLPVFLFGSTADVLKKAARQLGETTDGLLDIAGLHAPSRRFDPEGAEADLAIESIRQSGAKICFVALGAPKQEIFAEYARRKGLACGMICVGAAIDFIAGAQIRAPGALRKTGFEWVWRLLSNPRRLAKRYAECAAVFADLALWAPLRQLIARPPG
jgi:exopolysaccharide biosynthesis WecB/TagA/CpsF family protein